MPVNRTIIKLLAVICCITLLFTACGDDTSAMLQDDINELAGTVLKETPEASIGSEGGEWAVIGLAQSGADVPEDYFDIYYDNVRAYVKSNKGVLSDEYYTEYSRIVMALAAIDVNPRNVEGYDLLAPLNDFDKVISQGINGPVFALIASNMADITLDAQDEYIEYIMDKQLKQGGFGIKDEFDPSITAMVIQGLAPYRDRESVSKVINAALNTLIECQNDDGTFEGGSETVSQIIIALCAVGEDPINNENFTNGTTGLYDLLMSYKTDGGLAHDKGDEMSKMSTEQGLYALSQIKSQRR